MKGSGGRVAPPPRVRSIACAALAGGLLVAALAGASDRAPAPARAADTTSTLVPGDSGYADAQAFASVLEERGIHVSAVSRSMMSGFLGESRAASYRTDRGNFAVVFFP